VRRGEDHGVGVETLQRLDPNALRSDRHTHHLEPECGRDHACVIVGRRVLDREASGAARGEHAEQQRDPLGVAVGDGHVAGDRDRAPDPVEVLAQRLAQLKRAVPVEITESLVGRLGQHRADRPQPRRARERGDVGAAVAEVDDRFRRRRGGRRGGWAGIGAAGCRHTRVAAAATRQIALGDELGISFHHHPARDSELGCERAGGRQGRALGEPSGPDPVADRRFELVVQGGRAPALERDQQIARDR
jgi:hypothetical protein